MNTNKQKNKWNQCRSVNITHCCFFSKTETGTCMGRRLTHGVEADVVWFNGNRINRRTLSTIARVEGVRPSLTLPTYSAVYSNILKTYPMTKPSRWLKLRWTKESRCFCIRVAASKRLLKLVKEISRKDNGKGNANVTPKYKFALERFSNDCRKTNTKGMTPTNYNRSKRRDEPIRIPSNYL